MASGLRRTGVGEFFKTGGILVLLADGVLQTAGVVTFLIGLGAPEKQVLVRNDAGARSITVAPVALGNDAWGLGVAGRLY